MNIRGVICRQEKKHIRGDQRGGLSWRSEERLQNIHEYTSRVNVLKRGNIRGGGASWSKRKRIKPAGAVYRDKHIFLAGAGEKVGLYGNRKVTARGMSMGALAEKSL